MIWVTVEDVIAVHSRIIKASGGLDGIRDRNSLEAAVNAPLQTFAGFDLFETDLAKIARIGFGLASNHAFLDGNKRIGAMMTQLLLKWNGYSDPSSCQDNWIFALDFGNETEQVLESADWMGREYHILAVQYTHKPTGFVFTNYRFRAAVLPPRASSHDLLLYDWQEGR